MSEQLAKWVFVTYVAGGPHEAGRLKARGKSRMRHVRRGASHVTWHRWLMITGPPVVNRPVLSLVESTLVGRVIAVVQ